MESREGGGPREAGGGWGQALSPPLPLARAAPPPPPPRGALRVPNRAVGACEARGARSVCRLVQAAAGGLRRALTAAVSSDAAAAAAGASLPPPPGRRRGADPQRHLGRCTLLRRPGPLPPSSPFPCTSPFLITPASEPHPHCLAATSLLLTSFLSPRITTSTHFLCFTLLHYTSFL